MRTRKYKGKDKLKVSDKDMDRNRNKDRQPTGLPDSEIQRYQRILESLRKETSKSLQSLSDETRNGDPLDQTTGDPGSTLSREDLFQETDRRQIMVRKIDAALVRIQQGTFGVCVSCGGELRHRRLEALPWSEYCLPCQEDLEQAAGRESRSVEAVHIPGRAA